MIEGPTTNRWIGTTLISFLLGVSACGGDGSGGNAADTGNETNAAESREPASAEGATLTIGEQTFTFDRVLCAVGSEETGSDDTEFTLAAIQDGLQLDATISTRFGHIVSIDDIANRDDPGISWSAGERGLPGSDDAGEFIEVDGDRVTAEATFVDRLADTTAVGTLVATCR